jgi:hypothetical protein
MKGACAGNGPGPQSPAIDGEPLNLAHWWTV